MKNPKFEYRNPKLKRFLLIGLLVSIRGILVTQEIPFNPAEDTWANWEMRLDRAFDGVPIKKIPGRTMGIIVPSETRLDVMPLAAFGHQILAERAFTTVVILMQAPEGSLFDGLV